LDERHQFEPCYPTKKPKQRSCLHVKMVNKNGIAPQKLTVEERRALFFEILTEGVQA